MFSSNRNLRGNLSNDDNYCLITVLKIKRLIDEFCDFEILFDLDIFDYRLPNKPKLERCLNVITNDFDTVIAERISMPAISDNWTHMRCKIYMWEDDILYQHMLCNKITEGKILFNSGYISVNISTCSQTPAH